jgi:ankyrin repeat protein
MPARKPLRPSKTGLIDAVKGLDVDRVIQILDADPSLLQVIDDRGHNLLHLACAVKPAATRRSRETQVRLAGVLLDRGFDIDEPYGRDKCTALFEAVARARNLELVKLLLGRGADIHAAPGGGLFAAGWWEDLDMLAVLIDAGADIENVHGVTPFLACWCWKRFDAAKFLATRGADVNVQDSKGRTALYHGVERDFDPALLTWLVKHGASPDTADDKGVSARLKASRKRDQRFLRALGAHD